LATVFVCIAMAPSVQCGRRTGLRTNRPRRPRRRSAARIQWPMAISETTNNPRVPRRRVPPLINRTTSGESMRLALIAPRFSSGHGLFHRSSRGPLDTGFGLLGLLQTRLRLPQQRRHRHRARCTAGVCSAKCRTRAGMEAGLNQALRTEAHRRIEGYRLLAARANASRSHTNASIVSRVIFSRRFGSKWKCSSSSVTST